MKTKYVASTLVAAFALAAGSAQAQATAPFTRLELALATKHLTELHIGPGKSNLYFVAEGGGKFTVQGGVIHVWALCGAVDTIHEGRKFVYYGVGDCEFKSAAGGVLYATFKTPVGKGDRARLAFSGGTLDLARFNGTVAPMMAFINPKLTGKAAFYFDSVDDSIVGQDDPKFGE